MKPYYQDTAVTIYHGDAREILPGLSSSALVLTDPPWEATRDIVVGCTRALALWSEVCPLFRADRILLWLPVHSDPRAWLGPLADWPYLRQVYIRRAIPGYFGRVLMDGEIVHALGKWPAARKGRAIIPGGISITYIGSDRADGHPAPRSAIASRYLVKFWSDPGDVVVDPFAGSGTTLAAAKDLGRRAVGIELEERYCEIAAKRCAQETLGDVEWAAT